MALSFRRRGRCREQKTSWPAVLATSWLLFFVFGLFRSYGVLYLFLTRSLQFNRWNASLAFAAVASANAFSSALSGLLSKRVSVVTSNLCCCVLCGVALCIVCALPTTIGLVLAGLMYGLGQGLIECRSQTFVKTAFRKHRVLAVGLSTTGITLAGVVFPWLLQHLLREYGLRGSSLLLGAITLNGCIGTLLQKITKPRFRAPVIPSGILKNGHVVEMRAVKKRQNAAEPERRGNNVDFDDPNHRPQRGSMPECLQHLGERPDGDSGCGVQDYAYHKLRSVSNSNVCDYEAAGLPNDGTLGLGRMALSQDTVYEDCQSDFDPCELEGLPTFKRRRLLTEGSESYVSCYSVLEPSPYDLVETKETGEVTIHRRSVSSESIVIVPVPSKTEGTLRSRATNFFKPCLSLLKHGMFYICTLSFFLLYSINVIYGSTALDFAVDKGVHPDGVVVFLTYFSLADLAARLGTSFLTNFEVGSKKLMMMWVQCASGVLFLASPYLIGYGAMLATAIVLGLNLGCIAVLHIVLFEDYIGLHHVAWAFRLYHIVVGVMSLVMVPVIGYCRDTIGSYDPLFQVLGLLCLLNVFFWIFAEPFFKKQRASARRSRDGNPM
uniref:Putative monocarboxylate transporter n=1 Tax=Ixodes scapularis TaxID=6945 RepID=A0A4D5RHG3_IXOSC